MIRKIQTAVTTADREGWLWTASDLLEKCSSQEFHSGFAEIDEEVVDPDERHQLQRALLEALKQSSAPAFVSQIIGALGSARDREPTSLYIGYLVGHLRRRIQVSINDGDGQERPSSQPIPAEAGHQSALDPAAALLI